ncbi:MAG: PD-(D/E)XK nuclease family protein, partial [Bryobacteraceae bacterium]
HKTGRRPERLPGYIGGGTHLQPVLYGMAAEKLLDAKVLHGRLSYCTQRGSYEIVEVMLDKARASANEALRIIQDSITSGFLPAAPRKDTCAICDYRAVCGPYEEERVRRKPQDRLERLVSLRNQP